MGFLRSDRSLPWPQFLIDVVPLLKDMYADSSPAGVAGYLSTLAADASRLVDVPKPANFGAYPGFLRKGRRAGRRGVHVPCASEPPFRPYRRCT